MMADKFTEVRIEEIKRGRDNVHILSIAAGCCWARYH